MNNTLFHTPYFLLNVITILILFLPVIAMLINGNAESQGSCRCASSCFSWLPPAQ